MQKDCILDSYICSRNKESMIKNNSHYKKAERLLNALRNALDCANAIVFMLKASTCENIPETNELVLRQTKWNRQLETVIKDMEQYLHLIILYNGLSPTVVMRYLPNSFEINDTLNHIGYNPTGSQKEYRTPKGRTAMESFIEGIKTLEGYIARTFMVLVNAEYQGKWQYWGKKFSDLYMNMPYGISMNICVTPRQETKSKNECIKNAQVRDTFAK